MVKTIECRSLPLVIAEILSLTPSKYAEITDKQETAILKELFQSPIFKDELEVDEDDFNRVIIRFDKDYRDTYVLFGVKIKSNNYYSGFMDNFGTNTIFLYNVREDLLEAGDILRQIYTLGTIPADGDQRLEKLYDKIHKFFNFASWISIDIETHLNIINMDLNSEKFETLSKEYVEKIEFITSMIYAYNYLESNSGRNPISNPAEIAKMVFDLLEKELDKHPYDRPNPKIYKYLDHRDCIFELLDRLFAMLLEYDDTGYAPSILTNSKYFLYEIMKSYR